MTIANQFETIQSFFDSDITKDIKFRKKQLRLLKKSIKSHETELLAALKQDLGKNSVESYATEIGYIYKSISLMLKDVKNLAGKKNVNTPVFLFPAKSYTVNEPYGTVLIIGPFNYPFQLVMEPLIGAISAGNCAVVKPSELTPNVSQIIQQIIEDVFPASYISCITGEQNVTEELLQQPFDFIFFTGSTKVGQIVYEQASKQLIPVALELGGKSPAIVDKTANIKVAAERIAFGKFINAGQTCVAPDYVIIDASIKQQFIKAIQSTIQEFYTKNAKNSEDFGRIVNEKHANRLNSLINNTNGEIVYGGETNVTDRYIEPTIVDNVKFDDVLMEDEIFGPILPIMSYDAFGDAIQFIKNKPKPLSLYLFSEDENHTDEVVNRISFGGGCINDTLMHVGNHNLPFGGVGHSGIGRYHGKASFELFSNQKGIMFKTTKLETGVLFPPYKGKGKYVRAMFKK
ncbi:MULTISPECIES: aldehyde dehydrogenase [Mammaliicoccus]|uniref:Aldehyde dehydrogenase n=1 Tax=Mammaliicoccus lentus TaxID=42858 RepID=A0AAX3W1N0_MAMLE|nr:MULTISPECIES: aldehyde dehydrogenase [Mammaliicoccus]MBF0749475.1 aldehyde dehydrogenase [Mammaliicoccus lentus]MBF0794729.1 aldehyde dehydrogenase [Mammaliicoccus lentus]MBU6113745.1 aldehyde dehydrogenase [Mammaliicoccus lentus]MBW0767716.1 aldehyde dehydrogenase [Mammaliicoccus lentus]MBW0769002.1 aldehyde dehydrogenase [Mammaliicoccus lentus]